MRKILLSITIAFGVGTLSYAQDASFCDTYTKIDEFKASLSSQEKALYELDQADHEQKIQQIIAEHPEWKEASPERGTISYTIPIVFHILHEGGSGNISNDQVYDALEHMNKDYQKENAGWPNVVSDFLGIVADIEVEFVLAKKDPNGNCTNGITRTLTSETNSGNGDNQANAVKAVHGNWPGDEYLNIFVCNNIGGAAGYTMKPSSWFAGDMKLNGIFVKNTYLGTIGTAGPSGAHTLSHEAGHWLNLDHTWGGSNDPAVQSNCNIDDGVADTPNTIGWKTCTLSGTTCDGVLDNVENFMEYSYCSKMFTEGQKSRMWAALQVTNTGRKNIWSAANLAATGVNDPAVICEADFKTERRRICSGKTITFNDQTYNEATNWNWTFQGGTPANSIDQNPSVTYNTPGTYEVVLEASDGTTTRTKTKTEYITVLPATGESLPFSEGFENYTTLDGSPWLVNNPAENEGFEITSSASYSGSQSIKLNNFGEAADNIDEIASSPIDLSAFTSSDEVELSFRKAYRKRNSQNSEKLQVLLSKDCGETWQVRNTIFGTFLGMDVAGGNWTPSSNSDWDLITMTNITPEYFVSDFMVKFQFKSDGGNNIYIDDINIDSETTGLDEDEMIHSFAIYPNPADKVANVSFSTGNSQKADIALVDVMGQEIQLNSIQTKEGKNTIQINTENIEAGVYFVTLNIEGVHQTKRLIID